MPHNTQKRFLEAEHLRMASADEMQNNVNKLSELFPSVITEARDQNGHLKKVIDFEKLRQLLSDNILEGDEHYEFTWVGKKACIAEAARPIRKTLRPCLEESKNWEDTENIYIEGDNLEVLKLLQESYLGKIKMIYIDPPYNTGNDFIYQDNFSQSKDDYEQSLGIYNDDGAKLFKNTESNGRFHSDWCSMIYPRLLLARNLLSDDGVILISCDDHEIENLKKICNEVFGDDNFVTCFIWNCSTGGGIRPKFVSKTHEYILCLAKDIHKLNIFYAPLSENAKTMYTQRDQFGIYRDKDFVFKNKSNNINQKYYIECPDGEKVCPRQGYIFRFIQQTFQEALENNLVSFKKTNTSPLINDKGQQASWNIYIKKYLGNATGTPSSFISKEFASIYNIGTMLLQKIFDDQRIFENVKPIDLIQYFIKIQQSSTDEIILDFFSGSATTAHAVMQLNAEDGGKRKFIMVQLPEKCPPESEAYKAGYKNICEIGKERIRRAGEQIKKIEQSKLNGNTPDIGFRVFKIDSSNMKEVYYSAEEYTQTNLLDLVDNIKEDRTDLDLLFACIVEIGLPLTLKYRTAEFDGASVHFYGEQEQPALIACFASGLTENVIRLLATKQPHNAVFRDAVFADSATKINMTEIFKTLSPETKIRVL